MTKEELRKSLDYVNEERERLQRELERKDNNWNELKEFIMSCYIVGHKVQNGSLDMIINKIKELEGDKE